MEATPLAALDGLQNPTETCENVLAEFRSSLAVKSPITQRIYIKAASRALREFRSSVRQSCSRQTLKEWLESMDQASKKGKFGRVHAFERYLGGQPRAVANNLRRTTVRAAISGSRSRPLSSFFAIRDLGLLALWEALEWGGGGVLRLKLEEIEQTGMKIIIAGKVLNDDAAAALRRWLKIRGRLHHPREQRLWRRDPAWGSSPYVFPGSKGEPLSRSSLYAAMRRFRKEIPVLPQVK